MNKLYKDIQKLTKEEAAEQAKEARKELVDLNFKKVSNQLNDVTVIKKTKKKIARLLTHINNQ